MATRVYFSRHIPKSSVKDAGLVEQDIHLFNSVCHKAMTLPEIQQKSGRMVSAGPDLRKKENKSLTTKVSAHVYLKGLFSVDDYFANSAVNTAKAAIQSVKELNKLNIEELKSQKKDTVNKLAATKRTLARLKSIKSELVRVSKLRKDDPDVPYLINSMFERYDRMAGCFQIFARNRVIRQYDNAYLFEVQYVDPKMRSLKNRIRLLDERIARINVKIQNLQTELPGICFGSKKLFRMQYDRTRYPDHDVWLRTFRKVRNKSLAISGRKDAVQGNFLFRYDTVTHTLTYRTQAKRDGSSVYVSFSDVEFPYGQENVDKAVTAAKDTRKAVCWRIVDTGGSFLIQCMADVGSDTHVNNCYSDGCIAMDSNYDNLSVSEIDAYGNVKRHKVIHFDISDASSGHAEHIISKALDEAFKWCDESHKPFAMEDLSIKHPADRYGSRIRNRLTSGFAFSKITALTESKALKHSVTIRKVNPAYTSQAGKFLFMKKYGMSIHESASATIGRRAMGIHEKLPNILKSQLDKDTLSTERYKQWQAAYEILKHIRPQDIYSYKFA